MDHIEFISRPYLEGDRDSGIQIKINGRDLVELVRAVEYSFAQKEGTPSIAGGYAGLPPDEHICPPSRHFLGEPGIYLHDTKTQVLGCDCGEPGCWPLLCLIEVDPVRVRWSRFEQPHRSAAGARNPWNYDELGSFEFDRNQYERALGALRH